MFDATSSAITKFRGAHAPRVLTMTPSPSRALIVSTRAPKPALGARALPDASGFTILELLIVISIIIILAGLVLGISGYVQDKGARSRAEAEIAAMSAALESYKADNGIYPRASQSTDKLNARAVPAPSPSSYASASFYLYTQLSGKGTNQQPSSSEAKSYLTFKPAMLGHPANDATTVSYIRDPWGNSYGYSTAQAANPGSTAGYNPTFDLWSTTNDTSGTRAKWIKNW
ncbi:MAG: type II secretion system protein GspG [Verrucomicrobiota bacterium]|nr:type II secretion system protein GspG [Verrucomicrobiota bacterium]